MFSVLFSFSSTNNEQTIVFVFQRKYITTWRTDERTTRQWMYISYRETDAEHRHNTKRIREETATKSHSLIKTNFCKTCDMNYLYSHSSEDKLFRFLLLQFLVLPRTCNRSQSWSWAWYHIPSTSYKKIHLVCDGFLSDYGVGGRWEGFPVTFFMMYVFYLFCFLGARFYILLWGFCIIQLSL